MSLRYRFVPERCPRCGEIAREVRTVISCVVPLVRDDNLWQLDYAGIRRRGGHRLEAEKVRLRCGMPHLWTAKVEVFDDDDTDLEVAVGEDYDLATCEQLRPHVKWAIHHGASIAASGTGNVEWVNGCRATIDKCPGGYIVTFKKTCTVCTEEQLGHVLLVIDRELVR